MEQYDRPEGLTEATESFKSRADMKRKYPFSGTTLDEMGY